jgi:cobyric acid synthase
MTKEVKEVSVTVDNDGKELQKVEVEHKEIITYTYEQLTQQVAEAKAELEKKLLEKEQEIATLKQELELKSQEISNLTISKEETEVPVLTVGNILPTADKYREIQKGINAKAYPKK